MYECETQGVRVRVEPAYSREQSRPSEDRYVWAYTVHIANNSNETLQLLTRHWRITDASGATTTVSGRGVIGMQPTIPPGETFSYESAAPLATPSGMMSGAYQMQTGSGEVWDVLIPAFSLDSPHEPARARPN